MQYFIIVNKSDITKELIENSVNKKIMKHLINGQYVLLINNIDSEIYLKYVRYDEFSLRSEIAKTFQYDDATGNENAIGYLIASLV